MIAREPDASDLVGYITFDAESSRTTLVICTRAGRPLRRLALDTTGAVARFFRRSALRLGRYRRAFRAVAQDDHDARVFPVWIARDRSVIVSDAVGRSWMRSATDREMADRSVVRVIPNPDVITVVRRYGYGDASRN